MTTATLIKKIGVDLSVELFANSKQKEGKIKSRKLPPISESLKRELDESLEFIKNRKNLITDKKFWSILKKEYGV
jgi:hypothetical protein